jgi:hypothetical protein
LQTLSPWLLSMAEYYISPAECGKTEKVTKENITRQVRPCRRCSEPTDQFDGYCETCYPEDWDERTKGIVKKENDEPHH